jgi:hypothetical protein
MEIGTVSELIVFLWVFPAVLFICLPLMMLSFTLVKIVLRNKSKGVYQKSLVTESVG